MRCSSLFVALFLVGCGASSHAPAAAPNPEHLIYRDSVSAPPLGGPGSGSSSSVVLHEDGLLVVDVSPTGQHDERRLSPAELRSVLDALRANRAELLSPPPPEPRANDVSGTCEIWLDGEYRSFDYGGVRCNKLQGIIPQR